MNKLFSVVAAILIALPLQANALCDVGGARVVHAESFPFNNAGTTNMIYWVAPGGTAPTFYYTFRTANQSFINLLNAALISGRQVRVTGNAGVCGDVGTFRAGGTVVAVFMDLFN